MMAKFRRLDALIVLEADDISAFAGHAMTILLGLGNDPMAAQGSMIAAEARLTCKTSSN